MTKPLLAAAKADCDGSQTCTAEGPDGGSAVTASVCEAFVMMSLLVVVDVVHLLPKLLAVHVVVQHTKPATASVTNSGPVEAEVGTT